MSNLHEYFKDRCKREGECIVWTLRRDKDGYGRARFKGKMHLAHRLSYTLSVGPIPDGMCVCHRCDNRPCINPAHLFAGTIKENNDDMRSKGRQVKFCGEGHPRATLSKQQLIEALRRHAKGETLESISLSLGKNKGYLAKVKRGTIWAHLKNEIESVLN